MSIDKLLFSLFLIERAVWGQNYRKWTPTIKTFSRILTKIALGIRNWLKKSLVLNIFADTTFIIIKHFYIIKHIKVWLMDNSNDFDLLFKKYFDTNFNPCYFSSDLLNFKISANFHLIEQFDLSCLILFYFPFRFNIFWSEYLKIRIRYFS